MAVLRIERTFPAAPEKVFAFITQMDNLLKWWAPQGVSIREHNLDFSKLGAWSATMVGPEGFAANVGGEVTAIDPPHSVELTLSFRSASGERGDESVIRFDVRPNDTGGTHFLLTQSGLEAEHIPDMRDKGWASALAQLEQLINEH